MQTKGEASSKKAPFADLYADDTTDETGDPKSGLGDTDDEDEESGGVDECISTIESALATLKSKVGKK